MSSPAGSALHRTTSRGGLAPAQPRDQPPPLPKRRLVVLDIDDTLVPIASLGPGFAALRDELLEFVIGFAEFHFFAGDLAHLPLPSALGVIEPYQRDADFETHDFEEDGFAQHPSVRLAAFRLMAALESYESDMGELLGDARCAQLDTLSRRMLAACGGWLRRSLALVRKWAGAPERTALAVLTTNELPHALAKLKLLGFAADAAHAGIAGEHVASASLAGKEIALRRFLSRLEHAERARGGFERVLMVGDAIDDDRAAAAAGVDFVRVQTAQDLERVDKWVAGNDAAVDRKGMTGAPPSPEPS